MTFHKLFCYSLFLFSLVFFLTSCQERLDLDSIADIRTVVEARVVSGQGARVKLTKTISKTDEGGFEVISDGRVTVRDLQGNEETLGYQGDGYYESQDLLPELGGTYEIEVASGEELIVGRSTIPLQEITIDSITHRYKLDLMRRPITSIITLHFTDPADTVNYAVIKTISNGLPLRGWYLYDGKGKEGSYQQMDLELVNPLGTSSVLQVEFRHVEKIIHDYFLILPERDDEEVISGLSVAPPENPFGNLEDNAIGYFSGMTLDTISITIP